jgi:hypothetical protein
MWQDVLAIAGALVALALGLCALAGIIGRVVLLPWIRTHLLEPVQETNRQVTVNGHTSRDPTLKDSVHSLQEQYTELRRDIAAAAIMFDGHIAASERDRGDLWRAVGLLRGDTGDPPEIADPRHRKESPL